MDKRDEILDAAGERTSIPSGLSKANFVVVKQSGGPDQPVVLSYLGLRKAVGIIGLALPFVLVFGDAIFTHHFQIQGSVSSYYYTGMRNIFVGALWAIGVFLMSTKGYDWRDAMAGRFACGCALGVTLFPTRPYPNATLLEERIGYLHFTFAALLFVTLAYFCLRLFTESKAKHRTLQKQQRNAIYRACGWTILASIFLIGVVSILDRTGLQSKIESFEPVFWLETLSVLAFGFAWIVKGEAILKDQ